MSLKVELDKLKGSTIYRMIFKGQVLGLRVKIYDINERSYKYYDFRVSVVADSDAKLKSYLEANEGTFEMQQLHYMESKDIYASDDEINGSIVVHEFKDTSRAVAVLKAVISVIEESRRN